jgi:hypothetical protein
MVGLEAQWELIREGTVKGKERRGRGWPRGAARGGPWRGGGTALVLELAVLSIRESAVREVGEEEREEKRKQGKEKKRRKEKKEKNKENFLDLKISEK